MTINFKENALVTISPNYPQPKCGATRFRWQMHAPLPFVLPISKCLSVTFDRGGRHFSAGFHNHFDRETRLKQGIPCPAPVVRLVQKQKEGTPPPEPPTGYITSREYLQAVVVFVEASEYATVVEAFKAADQKIKDCFDFLGEHLGKLQRSLPYMATWAVYPVSVFDVGVVHHSVDHFCPTTKRWEMIGCGVAMSFPRQLRAPLFVADLQDLKDNPPEIDLANELLAEAQLAIFRRLARLAVLNSFTALETLANAVYRKKRTDQLVAWGVPTDRAESIAESERKKNRTDEKFLLGSGMKEATGRALFDDDKTLYDQLIRLEEKVRHQVAHLGARPTMDDARASLKACCEGVRWLCDVAGLPKKEMVATPEQSIPGVSAAANAPHTCSPAEMEVLRRMFGIVIPMDAPPTAAPPAKASDDPPDSHDGPTVEPEQ